MATTTAYANGGLAVSGSATTSFTHGAKVDADVAVLWDFGAGLEDVTSYVYELETLTGRDWPSQLQGKAGPGRLSMRLDNRDGRFSYFNADSPLNQGGRSLDPGATIRVQIDGTTGVDPVLLARDRFTGTLAAITTDELGTPWTHLTPNVFVVVGDTAAATSEGDEHAMVIDIGVADYFVQATIAELGDNVLEVADLQELNTVRLIYRWADELNYSYLSYGPFDGLQVHALEAVDVVAGVETSIFGPFQTVDSGGAGVDAPGDHARRITLGVHADGTDVHYYLNGCRVTSTPETGLQTSATHVGLYAYWGLLNRRPTVDQLAAWDVPPAATEGVIWTGTVVDVFPDAPAPKTPQTVTVTAEGALAVAAGVSIQPTSWAGRLRTGIALGDAVERAGLLYPPGTLADGDAFAGSSSDAEITALAHMRKLEEVEFGFLHEAPEGWLVYEDRSHRDDLDVVATFSDTPGAQFGYETFQLLQWRRELVNRVTAGVSYGAPNLEAVGGVESGASAAGVTIVIDWPIPTIVIDPGDLFVVFITSTVSDDSEGWLVPQWWKRERDTGASSSKRTQVYTHICDGNEGGTTVTFYNDSASNGGSFIIFWYQLRDWFGSHEGIHVGPWAVGESFAGADPETILPPWGDVNPSAFIAQRAGTSVGSAGAITNPTYPLGYVNSTDHFQNGSSNIHDCGMQACSKLAMAAIEDPSTFTGFANLNNAETSVIAIRGYNGSPPEPRGRLRVEREDITSQRHHNTIVSYDGCDLFPDEDTAETWCDLMLSRYAQLRPIVRLSFTATASGAYRALAYKLRLSDKVKVVATGDTGMGIDGLFHVESIAHRITDGSKLWKVTLELSPAG